MIAWYEHVCGPALDPVSSAAVLGRNDVDRRSFLRRAAYSAALSATALAALPEAARLVTVGESRRVGTAEVEAVHGVTDALHRLDEVRGGGAGRTAVAEFLSTDVAALLRSDFATSEVRSQAYSAAAELAYLAGFKAHDAGADGLAQRYYMSALRLAEESGVPGHDAWALRILGLQGTDIEQRRHSVDLAENAVRRANGKVGSHAAALFVVALARCHAENEDAARAREVLRRAEPFMSVGAVGELPRWIAGWTPTGAIVPHQAAKAFEAAGDLKAAQQHYALAASIWNPVSHARVHAITCAETALVRWRLGDEAGAADIVRPVLATLAKVDSWRTRTVLAKVGASFEPTVL